MKNNDLLNRLEILFPNEPRFADLRRAYVDKDWSSVFRLLTSVYGDDVDEIRKIAMEYNIYSIFKIIEGNEPLTFTLKDSDQLGQGDLGKFILHDNIWSMYRIILDIKPTAIIRAIKTFDINSIQIDNDALSQGQLQSKMWLINELSRLKLDLGTVFLCAGWYGILATLMFEHGLNVDEIRSFDLDPDVVEIADRFNRPWLTNDWQFKAVTEDIHNIDFNGHTWQAWSNANDRLSAPITDVPDTIINTSCEHIDNFATWYDKIPKGKLVVLQSNNYEDVDEHINISKTLYDFAVSTPMSQVLYSGELELEKYTRYMRIGFK